MIIEWDLNSTERKRGRKLSLKYYMMQLMNDYKIKDALIHFNTLMMNQEDHASEELFIMCESLSEEETII